MFWVGFVVGVIASIGAVCSYVLYAAWSIIPKGPTR